MQIYIKGSNVAAVSFVEKNSCEVALGQHRYNEHHDEVLQSTANAVAKKLTTPTTTNFTANLEAT